MRAFGWSYLVLCAAYSALGLIGASFRLLGYETPEHRLLREAGVWLGAFLVAPMSLCTLGGALAGLLKPRIDLLAASLAYGFVMAWSLGFIQLLFGTSVSHAARWACILLLLVIPPVSLLRFGRAGGALRLRQA